MDCPEIISGIRKTLPDFSPLSASQAYPDEFYVKVTPPVFKDACLALHKIFSSPVMMLFALDERREKGCFAINCVFADFKNGKWITISMDAPRENPCFDSLSKDMHSAALFEREIYEMFGIEPKGSPDLRRLNLHDEVCPQGNYPLRKDFKKIQTGTLNNYEFGKVEGEGVFEVPVGPVHAGIIGPGHFRFSAAGEPIINLEVRLGFTHRGVEKLFEGRSCSEGIALSERVSGDSSFAHSLAFSLAAEKISGTRVPQEAIYLRGIFLELERMYNHVNDISGMATDVGFSFPAAHASIIKEILLRLNEKLSGSRYLKNINAIGGVLKGPGEAERRELLETIDKVKRDFDNLIKMLNSSVSFMDRVDTTGVLRKKTAEDLGVIGLAGRASGIQIDLRKHFPGAYKECGFKIAFQESGDVLARLRTRISEFEESHRLIKCFAEKLSKGENIDACPELKGGTALGYAEGWRGPVLYWLKTNSAGVIERCKITDPSFHNWQALSYAVLGNIIPDFPLCNKSFDLSYSGNDL